MIKETLLELFYLDREQSELAKRSEYEKKDYYEIDRNGNEERLRKLIDKIYDKRLSKKISNLLDLTLDDRLKKDGATLDKYYKQGFKDGINLLIECIK